MLTQLLIQNYALIDDLKVGFAPGFTTITGETGAGKSILLEGLSLVLGNRADHTALRDDGRKCLIEAHFDIARYPLKDFFREQDLDYEVDTILRREILPGGKSRAFVNDSPVTLDVLSELGKRLVDVHSQHQTLRLTEHDFQLRVIDAMAGNTALLQEYRTLRQDFLDSQKQLDHLIARQASALKEQDYHAFLLQELQAAALSPELLETLEEQHRQLSNVETIKEQLGTGMQVLNDEYAGILQQLRDLKQAAAKLAGYGKHYEDLHQRIQSVLIETDDISEEWATAMEALETDPAMLEEVGNRLQLIYDLLKKHQVADMEGLITIREELSEKVTATLRLDEDIARARKQAEAFQKETDMAASTLSDRRNKAIPAFCSQLEALLHSLGMPHAAVKVSLATAAEYRRDGKDTLQFLFSANKGGAFGALKKVASGGELSRIMLAIKSILSQHEPLPTMMFDEIDTGVSGEISNRMAEIMLAMSRDMQIFSITHLPQVASKGDRQFKVYKEDRGGVTQTRMKELSPEERIVELAEMLGGKTLSESALAHARQLLN